MEWTLWIKNKKIVFFTAETIPSSAGGGRNAFYFARFLFLKGARTKVVCLNYNKKLLREQVLDNVQIKRLNYFNQSILLKIISVIFLLPAYIKQVKSNDVLIVYGRYLPGYISILLAGVFFHKKIIFRSTLLNDDDLLSIKKQSNFFWPLYKYIFRRISLYYAINKSFEERWRNVFLDKVPVVCQVQGVDSGIFNNSLRISKTLEERNKEFLILSCGIVIERKGYKQAFQALSQLNIPFKYIVIGQYMPDKYHNSPAKEALEMDSLYKLGNELLGNKIEFINTTENMADYFAKADIFIHLAKEEGTPNVLLEAMAIGVPIITRQFDGLSDIIKHGENMEVVNSDDELPAVIKKVYSDPVYANKLGNNAADTIKKEFTFEHIACKLFTRLNIG